MRRPHQAPIAWLAMVILPLNELITFTRSVKGETVARLGRWSADKGSAFWLVEGMREENGQQERRSIPRSPSSTLLLAQRWGPVLLWMVGIFYFSSQSSLPSPFSSRYGTFLHGVSHFGEYAILSALLYRALHNPEGSVRRSTFNASFVIGAVYALFDELHQGLVPGRDAELTDVAVDVAGMWVALMGIRGWHQFRGKGDEVRKEGGQRRQ